MHVESGVDGRERDFYGRQLKDWKGSAEIEQMIPKGLAAYGRLCGWTLARAHARSGDRRAIASYLGKSATFDRAIVGFPTHMPSRTSAIIGSSSRRSSPVASPPRPASSLAFVPPDSTTFPIAVRLAA